jgi:putative ABC transport system substrate-binding protein
MSRRSIVIPLIVAALVAIIAVVVLWRPSGEKARFRIGVTQFVVHPELDAIRKAIEAHFQKRIEAGEVELLFRCADADFSAASKIAQDFAARGLDMVIPITTVSAQPVVKACKGIPIVFAGVSDPVGAGLVKSLSSPGGNVTGTSDLWPFAEQFAMMRRVLPEARAIGYLYNPGEAQAEFALRKVRRAAAGVGFRLIERQVDTTSAVRRAALDAATSAELFYLGMDNTVGQAFDSLLKVCLEAKKPLFAGDADRVKKGALLCLGIDHAEIGKMTAEIAEQILFAGKKPGDIPVWQVKSGVLYYNSESFRQFGLELPDFVREEGKDVAPK